jgi:phage shock protein A
MSIFSRLKFVAKAEANKAIDKIEDPIALSEEAIRQMEEKISHARDAQASVQAIYIQDKSNAEKKKNEANDWNKKAIELNNRVASGAITTTDGEPLILIALDNHDKCLADASKFETAANAVKIKVDQMNEQIVVLEQDVKTAKEDLETLKARKLTADAMLDVNKELSSVGGVNSAHEILQRMDEKVSKTENLANAYQDLSTSHKTGEDRINEILSKPSEIDNTDRLAKFRESLH